MFIPWLSTGNMLADNLRNGRFPQQQVFGEDKFKQLPAQCRSYGVFKSVLGLSEHRFMPMPAVKPGGASGYLCAGISVISAIRHILETMAGDLLAHGRPASDIMQARILMVLNRVEIGGRG